MSETLYHVSANPHVRDNGSTQKIMLDVIIALLPATIFGIYIFGASAALTVAISVATCVVVEYIYQKLMKQPITVGDLSAALTGLLLALNLPSGAPFWMPQLQDFCLHSICRLRSRCGCLYLAVHLRSSL